MNEPGGRDPFWVGVKMAAGCLVVIIAVPVVLFVLWAFVAFVRGFVHGAVGG